MVELQYSVVSVGMVVRGIGPPWCRLPVGCRSGFDPCMPGCFGVGRLACGLFMVASLLLLRFGWCMAVLAARWLACSSLGPFCCCWRCRIVGCRVDVVCSVVSFVRRPPGAQPVMVSRCGLGLAVASMSDAWYVVLRPGCGRHVVLVRCCRSRKQSACWGLPFCPHCFRRLRGCRV